MYIHLKSFPDLLSNAATNFLFHLSSRTLRLSHLAIFQPYSLNQFKHQAASCKILRYLLAFQSHSIVSLCSMTTLSSYVLFSKVWTTTLKQSSFFLIMHSPISKDRTFDKVVLSEYFLRLTIESLTLDKSSRVSRTILLQSSSYLRIVSMTSVTVTQSPNEYQIFTSAGINSFTSCGLTRPGRMKSLCFWNTFPSGIMAMRTDLMAATV